MEWIIVAICLFLNAILASAEIAFVTLTRAQLRELVKTGKKSAETLFILRENPERTLSVMQIGISLVASLAAAVGGVEAQETFAPYLQQRFEINVLLAKTLAIVFLVVPLTFVNVVFAELVPKTLALRNPVKIALFMARPLMTLDKVFLPVVDILEWSTKKVLTLFFPKSKAVPATAAADTVELNMLSQQARQYVLNVVALEKKRVRDITLPWAQVDHVFFTQPINEVEAIALRSGHTRLPVIADGQVFGIINTKELLALVKSGSEKWSQIIRSISRVQEYETLFKALRQMQEKRSHLSAVFAGTSLVGIVTMEDILEEVIGEVYDEDDDGALKRILMASGRMRLQK